MNIPKLAENLRYAELHKIDDLIGALQAVRERRFTDDGDAYAEPAWLTRDVATAGRVLKSVLDPDHSCASGAAFGRYEVGCPACEQLRAGRPAKQGYGRGRYNR
jgi:hypothetical protein